MHLGEGVNVMSRMKMAGLGLSMVSILAVAPVASGAIVFSDDFVGRPNGQEIFNTVPSVALPGVGSYGAVLTFPYAARIDAFAPVGKTLKFDTGVGDDTQMVYLPYGYTFGSESVRLTITAAYEQGSFNNFAFGFAGYSLADNHNVFTTHLLVQEDKIQLNLPGTNTTGEVPFSASPRTFYTFELTYDPNLAGVAGEQPYTLTINGADVPIAVEPTTVYTPLTFVDHFAFGSRFAQGLNTRYISGFSFETAVPEPATAVLIFAAPLLLRRRRACKFA
jgi:hypothetical protein